MVNQQQYPFYRLALSPLATPLNLVKRQYDNRDEMNYFYLTHRSAFQKDRDRIINAIAFRRLKHKTQVFIAPKGDHYRTRLTHSLEVATLARSLARLFGVDEDLTEAIALAHDIGHPPFGHAGEEALNHQLQKIGGAGMGFDHNDQALRSVMVLESRYPHFQGINLTDQTLLGLAKHNGPQTTPPDPARQPMARALTDWLGTTIMAKQAGLEAQLASFCDDVAYNAHDIDDGFRAGLIDYTAIAGEPTLQPLLKEAAARTDDEQIVISTLTRKLISTMMTDIYHHTITAIGTLPNPSWQSIIDHQQGVVGFSPAMAKKIAAIKQFLADRVYNAPAVQKQRRAAEKIIATLVDALEADLEWRARHADKEQRLLAIKDYIAGMTDHFALRKFQELTAVPDQDLPFSPFRF